MGGQNLKAFRDGLVDAPPGSIDHHFRGRFLQPQFDEPEPIPRARADRQSYFTPSPRSLVRKSGAR
jgi:hypothetical protein